MKTFVLVHGAWHGGWSWQRVARRLEEAGHRAITPTLTGLGERAHLASRQVNLAMHIEDVVATMRYEDVRDVVLVGHSYAGMVITGVGAQQFDRVSQLVYYDAFLPDDGQSALDLLPPDIGRHFTESAERDGDGWLMPERPLEPLGVHSAEAKAWLAPRMVPHPLATYTDKLHFNPARLRRSCAIPRWCARSQGRFTPRQPLRIGLIFTSGPAARRPGRPHPPSSR
jgi:pimeloyl-ACP methyl ester carboxylesterase